MRETHVPDVPRASDPSRFPTQSTQRPSSGRGQGLNILRDIISGIIQQQPATQPNQPVQTTQPGSNPVATFIPPNGNSNNNPVSTFVPPSNNNGNNANSNPVSTFVPPNNNNNGNKSANNNPVSTFVPPNNANNNTATIANNIPVVNHIPTVNIANPIATYLDPTKK